MIFLRKKSLYYLLFLFVLQLLLLPPHAAADLVYSLNSNSTVSVIQTGDDAVVATISLPSGSKPTAMCLNPVTSQAYTLNAGNNSISIIDTEKQTVIKTVSDIKFTGLASIACDTSGKSVLISNSESAGTAAYIRYLNTETLELDNDETAVGNNPGSIVFNRDGSKAYILSQGVPSLTAIDMATRQTAITPAPVVLSESDGPYALALHTLDKYLYVVNIFGNSVSVIDPTTFKVLKTIQAGNYPNALAVSASSNKLYVADYLDTITLLDPELQPPYPTFTSEFPGSLVERNDGQRLYVSSLSDDSIRSFDTTLLTSKPSLITLPTGSGPQTLTTLSGTRHNLAISISGDGIGSVGWPFNSAYPKQNSGTVGVPEGIVVITNATADTCSNVEWTQCESSSGSGTGSANCTTGPLSVDKTIHAVFSKKSSHTISTTITGGNGLINCPPQACDGSNAVCSIIPETGYELSTLKDNGSDISGSVIAGTTFQIQSIKGDHSIEALFTIKTFTVTASSDSNGTITPSPGQIIDYGSTANFSLTPNASFTLVSVSGCGGNSNGSTYTTGPITGNCTVSAAFTPNTFTVTSLTPSSGGTISCLPAAVLSGGSSTCTVNPKTGYHLNVLNDNGIDKTVAIIGNSYQITDITSNHDVAAQFLNSVP
ncbi:MAG: hypothetical protein WCI45_09675, partial [Desulfuromonadales bacterium]